MMNAPISFEFFPPKTPEDEIKLQNVGKTFSSYQPEYFSVTYGAGGSTQRTSEKTVYDLSKNTKISVAPHLSCIGASRKVIHDLLMSYQSKGIHRCVALRGDLPSGMGSRIGEFNHADELVTFIREKTGNHFHIEVAGYPEGHPQAPNIHADLHHLNRKVQAGANGIITQYFYNPDSYFYFVDHCHKIGITVPIVAGIMPITRLKNLQRFSNSCGAEIPLWLLKRLDSYGEDTNMITQFGNEVVTRLCETLLKGGAPGLHFYTLNQLEPTKTIIDQLLAS